MIHTTGTALSHSHPNWPPVLLTPVENLLLVSTTVTNEKLLLLLNCFQTKYKKTSCSNIFPIYHWSGAIDTLGAPYVANIAANFGGKINI
jgi:hypothetical protein